MSLLCTAYLSLKRCRLLNCCETQFSVLRFSTGTNSSEPHFLVLLVQSASVPFTRPAGGHRTAAAVFLPDVGTFAAQPTSLLLCAHFSAIFLVL